MELDLELLDRDIRECSNLVNLGQAPVEDLKFLLDLKEKLKNKDTEGWETYNLLCEHLPSDDEDIILIIIKGHLLLEKLIHKFIVSRFPNPKPFIKSNINVYHSIIIAESLCLDNDAPKWLWEQIKQFNKIRNSISHELEDSKLQIMIDNFVSTVARAQCLENATLTNVIRRLYGMLNGLYELSKEVKTEYNDRN